MGGRSSTMAHAAPRITPAKKQHSATLIFLHGLGDDGEGWSDILRDHVPDHVKVICPHANEMPVTINGGQRMPAWFDLFGFTPNSPQDEEGIKRSSAYLESLISEEVRAGIAPERVMIGGFSQGGAIAIYTALSTTTKLGGVIALSCWLPMHAHFIARGSAALANRETPILQCHGQADPLLPIVIGQLTSQILKAQLGLTQTEFKSYENMGHTSTNAELRDVGKFIERNLPSATQGQAAASSSAGH